MPTTAQLFRIAALLVALAACRAPLAAQDPATDFPKQAILIRVVDENDQPVEGVDIYRSVSTKVKFPSSADFLTDRQGEANLILPQDVDSLRVWVRKKSYVPLFMNFEKRPGGMELPQGFVFRLTRGTTVGGFVVDEAGAPIRGARVEVTLETQQTGQGEIGYDRYLAEGYNDARWTDEKGFWSLDNVPAGDVLLYFWVSHPDFVSDLDWRGDKRQPACPLPQLRSQTARLSMEKGVKISGTLKDPEGKPVDNAMVVWGHRPYHNPRHQETFTDKNGIYHLPPLTAAPTVLTIVAEDFAPQLQPVTPTGATMNADFTLQRGATTLLKFVDSNGKPVPKVQVNIAHWRSEETLFNWRHPNVPYSQIPDQADEHGIWKWTWAPNDPVQYIYGKEDFVRDKEQDFGPGEHEVVLQRK